MEATGFAIRKGSKLTLDDNVDGESDLDVNGDHVAAQPSRAFCSQITLLVPMIRKISSSTQASQMPLPILSITKAWFFALI